MIRIVIENLLLFLAPTLIYVAYALATRRGTPDSGKVFDDAPLIWLFAAGAALVVVTLLVFGNTSGGKPGQAYVPPSIKDGKIEPGRIIK